MKNLSIFFLNDIVKIENPILFVNSTRISQGSVYDNLEGALKALNRETTLICYNLVFKSIKPPRGKYIHHLVGIVNFVEGRFLVALVTDNEKLSNMPKEPFFLTENQVSLVETLKGLKNEEKLIGNKRFINHK